MTLANQGRNALQILKYYYGNNIEIIRTSNIQSIPPELPRFAHPAGRQRHSGVHPATPAEPHHQGLSLPRSADCGRRVRGPDGCHGQGVPEAVQPDRRRRSGAADMVQDQLYLRSGQKACGAFQRRRGVQRHPLGRHMGRHRAAHRLHRQRRGATAVLAEYAGTV